MAIIYFEGTAATVAQITTVQVTAFDAATTYILTVGSQTVSVTGDTNVNTTAANLASAWNASAHPYFVAATAEAATDTVTMTADIAGAPFVVASSKSGGTGTIGATSTTTANSGPNDWSVAANFSGGAVPVNDDDVVVADTSVHICWGLAQSAVALDSLDVRKSYWGRIGLDYIRFATSADGVSVSDLADEYRETYLAIGVTAADGEVTIGRHEGAGAPRGSGRINLDLGSVAGTVVVHGTAARSVDVGRPAFRLKANSASTDLFVRSASGGVGVADDKPGETSTIRKVSVSDMSTASRVTTGAGTTLTTWEQNGGNNTMNAAATVTTATANGGNLTTEGDFTITALNCQGGNTHANHVKSGGNAITTGNVGPGNLIGTGSNQTRTWATINGNGGGVEIDPAVVTITTFNNNAPLRGSAPAVPL